MISKRLSRIGISDGPLKNFLWIKFEFSQNLSIRDEEIPAIKDGLGGGLELEVIGNSRIRQRCEQLRSPRRQQSHSHRSRLPRACGTRVDQHVLTHSKMWHMAKKVIILPTYRKALCFIFLIVYLFGLCWYNHDHVCSLGFYFNEIKSWQKKI